MQARDGYTAPRARVRLSRTPLTPIIAAGLVIEKPGCVSWSHRVLEGYMRSDVPSWMAKRGRD